jgi:hypothetical protein
MNSKLRVFVKQSRRNLRKSSKFIYDNFYAYMTDKEFLSDMNAKKALLESGQPGEVIKVAVQYPDGEISPVGRIVVQNRTNN